MIVIPKVTTVYHDGSNLLHILRNKKISLNIIYKSKIDMTN